MWRKLGGLVGPPAVVVCLFLGVAAFLWAATNDHSLVTLAGTALGLLFALAAVGMVYLVWLKRVNAEIDEHRYELRRDLDEIVDDEEQ